MQTKYVRFFLQQIKYILIIIKNIFCKQMFIVFSYGNSNIKQKNNYRNIEPTPDTLPNMKCIFLLILLYY